MQGSPPGESPASHSQPRPRRRLWLRRGLLILLLVVLVPGLYFAAAWAGSRLATHTAFESDPTGTQVYLSSNGAHAELWLPRNRHGVNWTEWLDVSNDDSSYFSIGWGERRFFMEVSTWDDLTLGTALPAILWPTESAVRVQAGRLPDSAIPLRISTEQYGRLAKALQAGFELDDVGRPIALTEAPKERPQRPTFFFRGRGSYHALRTCNLWTAEALEQTGIRTALWSPFAAGVVRQWPRDR